MTIERARTRIVEKPWGVSDLSPWRESSEPRSLIGEIWYEQPRQSAEDPKLLLKLLFTGQPLSVQVHPDDAAARGMGLPNGKSEAWYILSAAPGAKVAIGLFEQLTQERLREAISDGSIVDMIAWRAVSPGDTVLVPAGTIHAIGAGLVLAEIQQHSDATFRLFDHGRGRDLHVASAIAVANLKPAAAPSAPCHITDSRMLLASTAHFVLERINLDSNSYWELEIDRETWVLVTGGEGVIGKLACVAGDAFVAWADNAAIRVGPPGLEILAAYAPPGPIPQLLRPLGREHSPVVDSDHGVFAGTYLNGTGEFDTTAPSAIVR